MFSSRAKMLLMLFALMVGTSIAMSGCAFKPHVVNTDTMPGHRYKNYLPAEKQRSNPNVVYLGSENKSSFMQFGPNDVSFEFQNLK